MVSSAHTYQGLGMGFSVSPAKWQNFIDRILSDIPKHRTSFINHLQLFNTFKEEWTFTTCFSSPKGFDQKWTKHSTKHPVLKKLKNRVIWLSWIISIYPNQQSIASNFCYLVHFFQFFYKELHQMFIPIYKLTKRKTEFKWDVAQQNIWANKIVDYSSP